MKKILTATMALVLALSMLVGCGSTPASSAAPGSPASPATPGSPASPAAPGSVSAPAGDVTLELYLQKTNVVDQFGELIKKFEAANPGIKIELTSVPDPETALVSRIAAKDYPDIITIWPAEKFYRDLMKDGALLDISGQAFMSQVEAGPREIAQYDGKDYSLSMTMSAYGLIINNKIFTANGLKKPETWTELITTAKALKEKGVQPFTFYGKSTEQLGQMGERMIGIINNDITTQITKVGKGQSTWDAEPEVKQLAEALLELHQYGQVDILGADYDAAFNDMATEKAAMLIYGSWGIQTLLKMNPALDLEMIALPNPTGGKNMVPASIDTAMSISSSCKNPEAALKFLEFMSNTENAQWYADNEQNPSIIKGVDYKIAPLMTMQKKLAAGDMFFSPSVYWPAGFRTSWEAPLQALINPTGKKDVAAFAKATQDICVEYFAAL